MILMFKFLAIFVGESFTNLDIICRYIAIVFYEITYWNYFMVN
jgi:hypothetical protein